MDADRTHMDHESLSAPDSTLPWYRGLRGFLLIVLGLTFSTNFAIGFSLLSTKQTEDIMAQSEKQASTAANTLLSSLQTLMLAGDAQFAHDWLERVRHEQGMQEVKILRRDGVEAFLDLNTIHQVNDYLGSEMFRRHALPEAEHSSTLAEQLKPAIAGNTVILKDKPEELTFLMPIRKEEACNACHGYDESPVRGVLQLTVSTHDAVLHAEEMRQMLALIMVVGSILLALFLYMMVHFKVIRPVQNMAVATRKIAVGELSARATIENNDEIGALATSLNRMAMSLQSTTVSRDYFDNIINSLVDMLFIINHDGVITMANPAASSVLGYELEDLIGLRMDQLLRVTMQEDHLATQDAVEGWMLCADKGEIPVLLSVSAFDTDSGQHQAIYAARDMTKQKKAERELRLAAKVMDTVSNAIMVADADARIQLINPAFTEITGYSPEEAIGRNPSILRSGRQSDEFYKEMWGKIHSEDHWEGEIWNKHKDGHIYPEWLTINVMRDEDGALSHFVSTFIDITERKKIEHKLTYLAHHDNLTGLPNRLLFIDRLMHALQMASRNGKKAGVVFIDIDGFKPVNDQYGHDIGDELLQSIAERFLNCVRNSDTLARIGGDEFVVIMENVNGIDDMQAVSRKVLDALKAPFELGDVSCSIGASIGISIYPDDSQDLDDLIKYADTAMYLAKSSGRNQICVYQRDCFEHGASSDS